MNKFFLHARTSQETKVPRQSSEPDPDFSKAQGSSRHDVAAFPNALRPVEFGAPD